MPRLGPSIVRRNELEAWLARFKGVPVRFLIAPPGFGKSVALMSYLRQGVNRGVYCPLQPGASPTEIIEAAGCALGVERPVETREELLALMAERAPLEFAFDCQELPSDEGVEEILEITQELPDGVSLMVASRSRAAFQVARLVSLGTAILCDVERLAFSAEEIRRMADTCGVPYAPVDATRMLESTDGWPQVVSAAIRKAGEDGYELGRAFGNWRIRHGHLFEEFINDACSRMSAEESQLLSRLISGYHLDQRSELKYLEERGLFVIHGPNGYRPLRALARSRTNDQYEGPATVTPMKVNLFGWFAADVDGQPINWIRKRDAMVFKYIAVQPAGHISRQELCRVFWPDADRRQAAQSLRTVCSNIRKALAAVVGTDFVAAYFKAGTEVVVELENVVVDVNRFIANAEDGDAQFDRGDLDAACNRYRTGAELFRDELLIGDPREQWITELEGQLRQRHAVAMQRMADARHAELAYAS